MDSLRKGEKFQAWISSGSSPIYTSEESSKKGSSGAGCLRIQLFPQTLDHLKMEGEPSFDYRIDKCWAGYGWLKKRSF
jgi:hypothetical protein